MRVCLVSREYPTDDHAGGIGTYTEKTARSLVALGHRVDVVTEATGRPSTTVVDGVTLHRLRDVPLPRLRTLARSAAVAAVIEGLDPPPDVVQACEFGAEAVWYSLRRTRRSRLVTRLATPSFLVRELNTEGPVAARASRSLVDRLERLQTRRSDAIISISPALTDAVCARWDIPHSAVTPMKTGVDYRVRYATGSGALPAELQDRRYLLYFGRLEERKGVHILADALGDVLHRHPDLHAAFAGSALPYRGRPMDEYVAERNRRYMGRLHFFPRQSHHDLYPLLEHAAAVVLPSLWEGLGNVALEAVDMGKPVIATTGSGFNEVIEDGTSGVLVPSGDVAALRQAMNTVLDTPGLLEELSRGATAKAREFELATVARELTAFYDTLVSSPQSPLGRWPSTTGSGAV